MNPILILLIVSLAVSAVGWKYFIYFFSIGYGFSIVALGAAIAIMFCGTLSLPSLILCGVLVMYGCRLGMFLYKREKKSAAYRKILYDKSLQVKKPLWEILMVWVFCALLYVAEVSPVFFRVRNEATGVPVNCVWAYMGAALMVAGAVLEAVADAQKSAAKKSAPDSFVSTGVYRLVRCPNYLGEITLWTGCFVSSIGASLSVWQWVIASAGYLGILFVMFSGARRLELRQNKVYGDNPDYQQYVKNTPILLPFIPLYSVEKYKFLVA